MAKSILFACAFLVCSFVFASRPSPYASYFKQTQSGWEKVAVVGYTSGNIVTAFATGCAAVMRPEGPYNFQGKCAIPRSQVGYEVQLKMENFRYILYYQAIDIKHPDTHSDVTVAVPRYF